MGWNSWCRFRYNGKVLSRDRIRKIVTENLHLQIYPDLLFVIQQNRIQHFCCNDSQFLIDFIMEVGDAFFFIDSV